MALASPTNYDFSGYATRANVECSDGRIIMPDAFKHNDGQNVPLVWGHNYNSPSLILGNVYLEHRMDGIYAYGKFNEKKEAVDTKTSVVNGDLRFLSIHANQLRENGKKVLHGAIREVSVVIAGANPGATIDNIAFAHGDGMDILEEEAIITSGVPIELYHSDQEVQDEDKELENDEGDGELSHKEKTLQDVYNSLTEEQQTVVNYLVAEAIDATRDANNPNQSMKQSDIGEDEVKTNLFDENTTDEKTVGGVLTHDQFQSIVDSAKRDNGSLGKALSNFIAHSELTHAESNSITNIDYLFPEAQMVAPVPQMFARKTEWVNKVFGAAHKSPFSKIKTVIADLTADEARAKGYVTGAQKTDQVLALLKRTTTPTTVYKKQTLDRDNVVDITDINIVAWIKMEMRFMLEEELARAILVGDGRSGASPDKIDPTALRPIYGDDELYAFEVRAAIDASITDVIDSVVAARSTYRGSGNPTFFGTPAIIASMLLVRDTTGRRIYKNKSELASAMLVEDIVEVPVMENIIEEVTPGVDGAELHGIVVNMNDYSVGADKGGAINLFDDFDIDFNQLKYLIETRVSGSLIRPKSAMIITQLVSISG